MNKGEFITYMANQHGITKVEAERIINTYNESTTSALAEGNDIVLVGFGKFYATKVEAREGRNPSTGSPLQIPAYIQPRFTAGEKLKSACNSHENKEKPVKTSSDNKKPSAKKVSK
jgi:DNA-binding protein HU-beta